MEMNHTSATNRDGWPVALVLTVLLACPALVLAQSRDPLLGVAIRQAAGIPTFGDMAAGAIEEYGALVGEHAKFSAQIERARQQYWEAVKAGNDAEQQRLAYAKMLLAKDYHYLTVIYLPEGIYAGEYNPADTLTALAGQIDGGIRPMVQRAFGEWAEAVRTELGVERGKMINPLAMSGLPKALDATTEQYLEYVWQRDLIEFQNAGMTPPGMSSSEWNVFTLFAAVFFQDTVSSVEGLARSEKYGLLAGPNKYAYGRIDPLQLAHVELAEARRIFGNDRVDAALDMISSAPRKESPFFFREPLPCPPALGDWSDGFVLDAYYNHMLGDQADDPRLWFIADAVTAAIGRGGFVARIDDAANGGTQSGVPVLAAEARWDALVERYALEKVVEIVERVRAAPSKVVKTAGPRYRRVAMSYESMGVPPGWGHDVLSRAVELIAEGRSYDAYLAHREQERQGEIDKFRRLAPGSVGARVSLAHHLIKRDGLRIVAFEGSEQELDWLVEIAKGDPVAVSATSEDSNPRNAARSRRAVGGGQPQEDGKVLPERGSIARACTILGELTAQGVVSGGAKAAIQWFERGYALSENRAAAHLSLMLLMGKGVEERDPRRDPSNTFELAKAGAEQDFYVGLFVLAVHHEKGIGTPIDEGEARTYYTRAARFGHPIAKRWCDERGIAYGW